MHRKSPESEINAAYIRADRALLILLVLAVAVSSYIQFAINGVTLGPRSWGRNLGTVVGGALTFVALPALVIIPWRFIQRRMDAITNTPILVGVVLFLIFAALSLNGAMMAKSLMN